MGYRVSVENEYPIKFAKKQYPLNIGREYYDDGLRKVRFRILREGTMLTKCKVFVIITKFLLH